MGKQIDLTSDDLEELTEEELKVLEHAGLIEKDKDDKPVLKNEVRTK